MPEGTQPLKWSGYPHYKFFGSGLSVSKHRANNNCRHFDALFSWLKAKITIAWGIAPGPDESPTFWLKAIIKSIEYGFQPKRGIVSISPGALPQAMVKEAFGQKKIVKPDSNCLPDTKVYQAFKTIHASNKR